MQERISTIGLKPKTVKFFVFTTVFGKGDRLQEFSSGAFADNRRRMLIKNTSKNTIVAKNCKQATTLMELIFGLHWFSNPPELLFQTRCGIHTFFLKKPIDVLILSHKWQVVRVKENLKPNQFYFWNPKFQWVLELPAGVIDLSKTQIGDNLNFDPKPKS